MENSGFETTSLDELVQLIVRLAPHQEIVHHVPGRIRLKLRLSGLDVMEDMDVQGMVGSIPGVLTTRINSMARSVIVEYDGNRLPFDLWESLGQLRENPELETEVSERLKLLWGNNAA